MKVLFIFGTRPEAIKLAPLIRAFTIHSDKFKVKTCISSQHGEMLDNVLSFFSIKPDYKLNCTVHEKDLSDFTSRCLQKLGHLWELLTPNLVFIQGDTSTAFAGAIAGYYHKTRIAHIEAGLRTNMHYLPFPEEMHRTAIGQIADYHFAPTETAVNNLSAEGVSSNVWNVGNTGIDALLLGLDFLRGCNKNNFPGRFRKVDFSKRILIITVHRRENFGKPFKSIAEAIKIIARSHRDIEIIFPVHPNPQICTPTFRLLSGLENVHLVEPIDYPVFIWLLKKSFLIITDSGGIQEEASFLHKPALIIRDDTERIEGVHAGVVRLVGTDQNRIIQNTEVLLKDINVYGSMIQQKKLYGDGSSSSKILKIINARANEIMLETLN